jgi:general secretion pathway protein G
MKTLFSNKTKKAFTLVEMLIVIVIIGILAAALIPRLSSARGRANDTARKADLQQVANGLVAYQIDHGSFPAAQTDPSLSAISGSLISA